MMAIATPDRPVPPTKHILCFTPSHGHFEALTSEIAACPEWQRIDSTSVFHLESRQTRVELTPAHVASAAIAHLAAAYVHILLVDLRGASDGEIAAALGLLDELDDTEDIEARYGFHRIVTLVSGCQPATDELIRVLGSRGVGRVLRDPGPADERFVGCTLGDLFEPIDHRRPGQRALCASGGGITGIYFELGALKCLDDCTGGAMNDFDMYFGISAGAVVNALIATGFAVEEVMAAIAGYKGGRIPPISLQLLRLSHVNFGDLGRRLGRAASSALFAAFDMLRRRNSISLDALIFEYGDALGPPFRTAEFESLLREVLRIPGATNDFGSLRRPLYVGASNQDTHDHVLFGEPGRRGLPISRAVQASMSVNPAFSSVRLGGHFFEDGAITRTSHFSTAIQKGASLVIVIDPFVPYVSRTPGYARARGVFYNIDQNIRTISYTRFENTRNWVLRKHPEVSSYTFLPSNRVRQLLSVAPIDHRPYLQIWRGAYLSTLQRIHRLAHRMRGDFAAYGIPLDTSRAEAIAERLGAVSKPVLADFFVDGRIELREPTLALDYPLPN